MRGFAQPGPNINISLLSAEGPPLPPNLNRFDLFFVVYWPVLLEVPACRLQKTTAWLPNLPGSKVGRSRSDHNNADALSKVKEHYTRRAILIIAMSFQILSSGSLTVLLSPSPSLLDCPPLDPSISSFLAALLSFSRDRFQWV